MPKQTKQSSFKPISSSATAEFVRSSQYRTLFSNSVRISFTPLETRMTFINYTDGIGLSNFVNEEEATVIMTPTHLKMLYTQMRKAIEQYEKQFGVIAVFPDEQLIEKTGE